MTIFLRWLDRLPSWLRAGVVTGAFVAIPGFLATLTDIVSDIASWAAGEDVPFPDLSTLRAAAVAVVAGAITGGLNALYRWVQERLGRGNPPVYPTRRTRPLRAGDTLED